MGKTPLTIGIPTYYGGPSLVKTCKSLKESTSAPEFRLIVTVDGNQLKKEIKSELKKLGVELIENKDRGGQVARINQLIEMCDSEFIILTQDDILFEKDTVKKLFDALNDNKDVTMISGKVVPLPARTFFEKIVHVGVDASYQIGTRWENADNYFLAGGRCLGFRTSFVRKLHIPEENLNSDTYLYFANKKAGGKFLHVGDAIYHMRSPMTLRDHMKQSKKYQFVREEIIHYLQIDVDKEQPISLELKIQAFLHELAIQPFYTILYFGLMIYTRIMENNMYKNATRFWDTDPSTKEL